MTAQPDDDAVLEALHGVLHQFKGLRHRALRDMPGELAPMAAKALGFFSRHPGATASDLAEHSGRDKAQVARLIASLKAQGLLDALPDEQDRRVVHLHPSAQARALHQGLQRSMRQLSARAIEGLSAAERQTLLGLLARIRANLDRAD